MTLRGPLRTDEAGGYAATALACVHRAYPNQIVHVLDGDGDALPPQRLHPVFWGCFDWHSAVHGHWTLAAYARRFPSTSRAAAARAALARSFTSSALAAERAYLEQRPGFERPYGLAWLCALHAELVTWVRDGGDADVAAWARDLAPLAALAGGRIAGWLERLGFPNRVGTHAQSAFAAGLALDWAEATGDEVIAARLISASHRLHDGDRGPALHLEPSGEDFLSPALGAADLMRRVLPGRELAAWLDHALPELHTLHGVTLLPPRPTDRSDGRLVHLDGLCASRAWMLAALARALPDDDPRRGGLDEAADAHAGAALAALGHQSYAGDHWLGTFAMYLRIVLSNYS